MDPQVQQAIRRMAKSHRQMVVAIGLLAAAALNSAKAIQGLSKEMKRDGHWVEATSEEKDEVEEAVADMVATYASQVN